MSDAYVTGLFTLAGTGLGFLGALLIANRTAKVEERRHIREIQSRERQHYRELGMKMALNKSEWCAKLAQQLANATGRFQEFPPFEAFIIDAMKFMDIVATPDLSAEEMARRMAELRDFIKIIRESAKQKN